MESYIHDYFTCYWYHKLSLYCERAYRHRRTSTVVYSAIYTVQNHTVQSVRFKVLRSGTYVSKNNTYTETISIPYQAKKEQANPHTINHFSPDSLHLPHTIIRLHNRYSHRHRHRPYTNLKTMKIAILATLFA
jgi:hypothetical protein